MQNKINTNGKCFILVEVPVSAHSIDVYNSPYVELPIIDFFTGTNSGYWGEKEIYLPPGKWRIIGKLTDQPPQLPDTIEILNYVREKGLSLENQLILEEVK